MKCINKFFRVLLPLTLCASILCLSGCGKDRVNLTSSLQLYEVDQKNTVVKGENSFFSKDLCVTDDFNLGTESTNSEVATSAAVFNITTQETLYRQNIFERIHPASTTKVMTAYIILRDCKLDDKVTVSESIKALDSDSSVCNIETGDTLTVEDLLYGLLLNSGNDAAVALAEHHSHSVDAFAKVMNETAKEFGATQTNFVNPHGLDDDNHYTTAYDMYLIFNQAIKNETFVKIITSTTYKATYTNKEGSTVENVFNNTNRYLKGKAEAPEGITVIGGKTGTTGLSGYCLVLLSENENKEQIISLVYKADGSWNLYLLMNQILAFAKK